MTIARLLVLVLVIATAPAIAMAQPAAKQDPWPAAEAIAAQAFSIDLSLPDGPGAQPLAAGEIRVTPLQLEMRGLMPGDDVYAAVFLGDRSGFLAELIRESIVKSDSKNSRMALNVATFGFNGPAWLTRSGEDKPFAGFARLSAEGLKATFEAKLGRGARSFMQFGDRAAPVHLAMPAKGFETLVKSMAGSMAAMAAGDEKDLEKIVAADKDDDEFMAMLNLVFLATATQSETERLSLKTLVLTPTNLPFSYDSVVLIPAVVRRDSPDAALVHIDFAKAPPLALPASSPASNVAFNLEKPAKEPPPARTAPSRPPLPELAISIEPGAIPRGRTVTKRISVRHGGAAPGAEIYVALQPAIPANDTIIAIREASTSEIKSQSMSVTACRTEAKPGLFQIRESPIFVDTPGLLLPDIEAGRLGVVRQSEGGQVDGKLTFTAPALAAWYSAVRATPLLFQWDTKDGSLCATAEFKAELGVDIPLLGR